MDIKEIFAELGRMHLEIKQLQEKLATAQAQLSQYTEAKKAEVPQPLQA